MLDLDGDGTCELIGGDDERQAVFRRDTGASWRKLPFTLPAGTTLADDRDTGLRFVDVDQDGRLDVISSNERGYSAHLFVSNDEGWSRELVSGPAGRSAGDSDDRPRRRTIAGPGFILARCGCKTKTRPSCRTWSIECRWTICSTGVLFPGPKSPEQSLAITHVRPGFQVELVASEPLVMDPIAIAWGPDGKLWVAEMGDYPRGVDGHGGRGGRVRFLEDTDGDGRYDRSTLFLEGLGFPNGVTPWRNGVIISCARTSCMPKIPTATAGPTAAKCSTADFSRAIRSTA